MGRMTSTLLAERELGDLPASEMKRGRIVSTPNRLVKWRYSAKGIRTRKEQRPNKLKAQHGPRTVSFGRIKRWSQRFSRANRKLAAKESGSVLGNVRALSGLPRNKQCAGARSCGQGRFDRVV